MRTIPLLGVGAIAMGIICHFLSLGRLSQQPDAWGKALWMGAFAPRRAFLPSGWRLHLASIGFGILAMLLVLVSSFL